MRAGLAVLVALVACAAPAPPPAPPARVAPAGAAPAPMLWEIDAHGAISTLFGTIHAGVDPDRELPRVLWERLAAADTVVLEADLTSAGPREVLARAALPEPDRLDRLLGADDWRRLRGLVGGALPDDALRRLQPWFVYGLVLQRLYPVSTPIDLAVQARARSRRKRMVYLEAWRTQLDLLAASIGLPDLRALLARGPARARLDALMAAYRAGDLPALAAIVLDPAAQATALFDDRNRAWRDALVPHLVRGGAFVAVGVGHLPGDAGLLALLRRRGFVVRRIAR